MHDSHHDETPACDAPETLTPGPLALSGWLAFAAVLALIVFLLRAA